MNNLFQKTINGLIKNAVGVERFLQYTNPVTMENASFLYYETSTYKELDIDSFTDPVITGKVIFMVNDFSDDDTYFSEIVENPNIVDFYRYANEGILAIDAIHNYVELIDVVEKDFFQYLEDNLVNNPIEIPAGVLLLNIHLN